jgi:hypothetical protein
MSADSVAAIPMPKIAPDAAYDLDYDGYYVWLIEDGEKHWYVAENPWDAIREHSNLMDSDADSFKMTRLPLDTEVVVIFDDYADARQYWGLSTFACIHVGVPDSAGNIDEVHSRVVSTCAGWAAYFARQAPQQICSSCFP